MWPPPSRDEIAAANRYAAYRDGWRDGAASRARAFAITVHADEGIRSAYDLGYADGQKSYSKAMLESQRIFGHVPNPLRA